MSKRADALVQIASAMIMVAILYLGAEKLLLQKYNMELQRNNYAAALKECRAVRK